MDGKQFQRIAKALADPRRFKILEMIAGAGQREMCCGDVVCQFPVTQATVSHHLKELTDAGLLEARTEGQFKLLSARPDVLIDYIEELRRRVGLKQSAPPAGRKAAPTVRRAKSPPRR